MSDVKLSRQDLSSRLHECRAMAVFLADAVNLILEENGTYKTKVYPVPYGASACIITLSEKITAIEQAI
jgi:hypothetical protein